MPVNSYRPRAEHRLLAAASAFATLAATALSGASSAVADIGLPPSSNADGPTVVRQPYDNPGGGNVFYFLLTDRFANGDTSNDNAVVPDNRQPEVVEHPGDRQQSGYDPTDIGYYQGGDLAGVAEHLDYISGLGATAIWLTPPFTNQAVSGNSAGYHGYWTTDFTRIDPHLGGDAAMENLLVEAQSTDTKVFFDVVVNHTADTISYQGVSGGAPFVSVEKRPYTDASGAEIDLADWADDWALFPELDAATSFPYVPYRPSDTYLVPEQLNDLTWYHNRGEANLSNNDASSLSGDFAGLDDLMTERGELALLLADEMVIPWIQLGLAGIRIDTVKYVGLDFWTLFTERIATSAAAKETDSFFMFGEAYDADVPNVVSPPMRQTDMDSMLDFPFAFAVQDYVKGGNGSILRDMFERDDYYITAGTDPNDMVTFVSNHDMGRIATIIGASKPDLEQRVKLAYALEFLSRGQPVVYYGDEQGFVGTGGDKEARQTMFGPVDGSYEGSPYADDPLLGGGTLGSDYEPYDTSSGMYRYISELAALREAHPALASGAQVSLGDEGPVYAFARVLPDEKRENIVAVNSSSAEATIHLTTLTPDASYTAYYPADLDMVAKADSSGALTLTVPAYGAIVLGSNREVADAALSAADYTVTASAPFPAQGVDTAKSAKVMVQATAPANRWTQTSVYARVAGGEWIWQGTDTGPNPRVFVDVSNFPDGADLEFRAVTTNAHGDRVSASVGKSASLDHPEDYQGGSDTFPNWEFMGLLGGVFFGIIGLFIVVAIVGRKRRD